jgi:Paraquat-inducible protein A
LLLLTIPLLLTAGFFSLQIQQLSNQRAYIKTDYSIVNNITRGLLSVNAWKDHIVVIVTRHINNFEFTPEQENTLKTQLGHVLHAMINKADTLIHKKQKTIRGKLKKMMVNILVDEKKIHAQVPLFSQTILDEIKKPENKANLKKLVLAKIEQYGSITYDSTNDIARIENILADHSSPDVSSFNLKCESELLLVDKEMYAYTFSIIGIIAIFLVLWFICRKQPELYSILYACSVALALIVLVAGLTSPMIEIDARIKETSFLLIGEKIAFHDQVIFFQSKSIVDVVHVLIKTGKWDSIMVGILILVFSILFPLAKLISSKVYLLGNSLWRHNKLIKFFTFKSGKWSMADVYVVAIFMAYIGFKGILNSQLSQLNMKTESLASISTNETTLQPGFLLFVCFVLFGLLLSTILEKITAVSSYTPAPDGTAVNKV